MKHPDTFLIFLFQTLTLQHTLGISKTNRPPAASWLSLCHQQWRQGCVCGCSTDNRLSPHFLNPQNTHKNNVIYEYALNVSCWPAEVDEGHHKVPLNVGLVPFSFWKPVRMSDEWSKEGKVARNSRRATASYSKTVSRTTRRCSNANLDLGRAFNCQTPVMQIFGTFWMKSCRTGLVLSEMGKKVWNSSGGHAASETKRKTTFFIRDTIVERSSCKSSRVQICIICVATFHRWERNLG